MLEAAPVNCDGEAEAEDEPTGVEEPAEVVAPIPLAEETNEPVAVDVVANDPEGDDVGVPVAVGVGVGVAVVAAPELLLLPELEELLVGDAAEVVVAAAEVVVAAPVEDAAPGLGIEIG